MCDLRLATACTTWGLLLLALAEVRADAWGNEQTWLRFERLAAWQAAAEPREFPAESSRRVRPEVGGAAESQFSQADPFDIKPLDVTVISLTPPPGPSLPPDLASPLFQQAGQEFQPMGYSRRWNETLYSWTAPSLAYKPLLFEDVNLERYGFSYGALQPAVSAACFFGRLPVLPYMCGATPCCQCYYDLGYDRPGDCVPHFFSRPRLSLRGALYEGAAATGLVFLIP